MNAVSAWRCSMVAATFSVLTCCAQTPTMTRTINSSTSASVPIPSVTAINLSGRRLQRIPITFGQPFRTADIPAGNTVVAYLGDRALETQTDIKARNPDGSVRHAVLTVLLPTLDAHASETLDLRAEPVVAAAVTKDIKIADVLRTGFNARVSLRIAGQPWQLDARTLLEHAEHAGLCKPYGHECNQWLSGPLASEWVVGGPVLNARGKPHPHLAVYFAVRAYGPVPVSRVRVDVIVENDWAYEPDPKNILYDGKIEVGNQTVYTVNHLEHYRQARWHKVFWWGAPDPVYAQLSSSYLQASRAVPRYEKLQPSAAMLEKVRQDCDPMQWCDQTKTMGNTGAQQAIGPLARWSSVYVVDPTYRAYRWMLANDDALGSYGIHYRDQLTGQPVSVEAHPCMTLYRQAEVVRCPVSPYHDDVFPRCSNQCESPLIPDESHHPEPAYVAYLVTGDWYYLEELEFWADWVIFHQNPAYRGYADGLIEDTQIRGQAWALRTLGYAAYILPDQDPMKGYFNRVVENNIQWYNKQYTENPDANKLHITTNGYAVLYPNRGKPNTGIATWQQSFFNWAIGNLADLGFTGAGRLRDWFSYFQINLMTSQDFCWVLASSYELQVRDTKDSPLYHSLKSVYTSSFPELKGVRCNSDKMAGLLSKPHGYHYFPGVMVGYPYSPTGFTANFQIGLAASADSNVADAILAWKRFESRRTKPDYSDSPQFAVVPRSK
jgi:hypothetical protein